MLHIVAYDIADNKRRLRVAKILLDFGERLQYSVFACDLNAEQLARLSSRLQKAINLEEDRIHVFRLCKGCENEISVLGKGRVSEQREVYII